MTLHTTRRTAVLAALMSLAALSAQAADPGQGQTPSQAQSQYQNASGGYAGAVTGAALSKAYAEQRSPTATTNPVPVISTARPPHYAVHLRLEQSIVLNAPQAAALAALVGQPLADIPTLEQKLAPLGKFYALTDAGISTIDHAETPLSYDMVPLSTHKSSLGISMLLRVDSETADHVGFGVRSTLSDHLPATAPWELLNDTSLPLGPTVVLAYTVTQDATGKRPVYIVRVLSASVHGLE